MEAEVAPDPGLITGTLPRGNKSSVMASTFRNTKKSNNFRHRASIPSYLIPKQSKAMERLERRTNRSPQKSDEEFQKVAAAETVDPRSKLDREMEEYWRL